MAKIKLNESQFERLFEAARSSFSIGELESLGSLEEKYRYCLQHLGMPVDEGSSRLVFMIDDEKVLKLAMSNVEQNKREAWSFEKVKGNPIAPIVYYCANDFSFLVEENVVPCSEEDFEMYIGVPFNDFWWQHSMPEDNAVGYNKYFKNLKGRLQNYEGITVDQCLSYLEDVYGDNNMDEIDDEMEAFIDSNEWLKNLKDVTTKIMGYDYEMNNFGLAKRNGEPYIVLLDAGMESEESKRRNANG